MKKKSVLSFGLVLGLMLAAVGASAAEYQGVMKTIPHATIHFAGGSAQLSDSDRSDLRKMVAGAREASGISEVTVAAWSDKSLPKGDQELSAVERGLATDRANAVSAFIKEVLGVSDVTTYNMAETSNWLARAFHTTDAELKSMFSKRGAKTPVTNAELQVIRNEGAPSEAVVVVVRKYEGAL